MRRYLVLACLLLWGCVMETIYPATMAGDNKLPLTFDPPTTIALSTASIGGASLFMGGARYDVVPPQSSAQVFLEFTLQGISGFPMSEGEVVIGLDTDPQAVPYDPLDFNTRPQPWTRLPLAAPPGRGVPLGAAPTGILEVARFVQPSGETTHDYSVDVTDAVLDLVGGATYGGSVNVWFDTDVVPLISYELIDSQIRVVESPALDGRLRARPAADGRVLAGLAVSGLLVSRLAAPARLRLELVPRLRTTPAVSGRLRTTPSASGRLR